MGVTGPGKVLDFFGE